MKTKYIIFALTSVFLYYCSPKEEKPKLNKYEKEEILFNSYLKDYNALKTDTLYHLYTYQIDDLLKYNNRIIINFNEASINDIVQNDSSYTVYTDDLILNCSKIDMLELSKEAENNKIIIIKASKITRNNYKDYKIQGELFLIL